MNNDIKDIEGINENISWKTYIAIASSHAIYNITYDTIFNEIRSETREATYDFLMNI